MTEKEIKAEREKLERSIKRAKYLLWQRQGALEKLQKKCKHPGVKLKQGSQVALFNCPYCGYSWMID